MRFLANLQKIDRRIMYLLLAVVVFVPLQFQLKTPLVIMDEVDSVYSTVQKTHSEGKIAWVSNTWGPGTKAENQPQMETLVRHMFAEGVPFVLLCWDQQGTTLAEQSTERIAKEMGKVEGVDWASTGFRPGYILQFIKGSIQDMNKTLGKDRRGKNFADLPITKGKDINDIGMTIELTASASVPVWISFLGQTRGVDIVYCPTSVMVPEGYNYVDSKQVAGMLPGLIGAAQYDEVLYGKRILKEKGYAHRGANALSMSHALIIVLIILGNVGYFVSRRRAGQV